MALGLGGSPQVRSRARGGVRGRVRVRVEG